MNIDRQKLKRLAEVATQGEWSHERFGVIQAGPVIQFANGSGRQQIAMATGTDWMAQGEQIANAEFMAAANPSVVLALLAEIERLETQVRLAGVAAEVTVHQEVGRAVTRELVLAHERDQLQADNEALRKDAGRYRWLRDKQTFIWLIQDWFPGEAMLTNVDADIDAAMAKETSHG